MMNLRSLGALLFLTLATASAARAQMKVGAFGDLNRSDLSGDAPSGFSYSGRNAIGFGLIGELRVASDVWISVQPTLLPRGAGIQYKFEGQENPEKIGTVDLDYLAVPVLAKFVTAQGRVYITSGINVSFLTGAKIVPEGAESESVDVKNDLKDIDVAADFGVGGQFPLGPVELMLEARYEQGILNTVQEQPGADEALHARLRSSGLQLLAGILLTLGGDR